METSRKVPALSHSLQTVLNRFIVDQEVTQSPQDRFLIGLRDRMVEEGRVPPRLVPGLGAGGWGLGMDRWL